MERESDHLKFNLPGDDTAFRDFVKAVIHRCIEHLRGAGGLREEASLLAKFALPDYDGRVRNFGACHLVSKVQDPTVVKAVADLKNTISQTIIPDGRQQYREMLRDAQPALSGAESFYPRQKRRFGRPARLIGAAAMEALLQPTENTHPVP